MNFPIYNASDLAVADHDGDEAVIVFSDFINQLIDTEEDLTTAEERVVNIVNNQGTEGLSSAQRNILTQIVERYEGNECITCGTKIPLNEAIHFLNFGDGLCSYHEYTSSKED
jgi:hypothetical protein